MFKIVSSVLHLCNLEFKEAGEGSELKNDASGTNTNQPTNQPTISCLILSLTHRDTHTAAELRYAAEMLDLEPDKLLYALVHKKIQMRSEIIHKPMNPTLARDQVYSFAKYLYSTMFEWMVNKLNACTHAEVYQQYIGVLDIFGFEKFEVRDEAAIAAVCMTHDY